jgi:hypothetical protein
MPLPANLAVNPDEFIDYYELLDQPQDATTAELRGRINDLYSDAQANRDHRNPQKRREYQLWLDLLPQARSILTDDPKRAKYDEYRQRVLSGAAVPDYPEFLRELEGKPTQTEESASVLGLRDETPQPVAKSTSAGSGTGAPAAPAGSKAAIFALAALVVGALIGFVATKDIAIALIAGAVVAAIVFFATRGGNKIAQ